MEQNIVIPMSFNNDKKKPTYDEVVDLECPYDALGDRIIIVHIDNEESKKKKSGIYIPEHIKKSIEASENLIVPGIVKSVGRGNNNTSSFDVAPTIEVNDIVYTYPGGYEAKITKGEIEYLIFSRRDILIKVK